MADRRLQIAIDGRELAGRPTGVGRYLREILRAWSAAPGFPHRVTVVVPQGEAPDAADLEESLVTVHVDTGALSGTLWEQVALPRLLGELSADVLFAPGYSAPLRPGLPFVVAMYDVSFCAHPEWFARREGIRRRWFGTRAARRASSVITISEFSADEIVRWMRIPRDRIRLAPPGAPRHIASGEDARAPIVLFVGSLFNRRHIPELIAGFAAARQHVPGARLVLVGDNRMTPPVDPRRMAADVGVADAVDWRSYVDDASLEAAYRTARVFAFLSDYEGFAMTPLEAIACGAPPVLLDTAVAVHRSAAYSFPVPPIVAPP
jgi:glycosyltransferase involved in cell wall biosynthesis